jgi:3-hydroxyacyl-CoA dehydrogenase
MSVEYTEHDGVALLTLVNPPVNGLGHATRSGIVEGVRRAQADPAIRAIVITGAGRAFSGGADITEFNTPKATAEPMLGTVIAALENSAKPVVAALHSVAMGGGLELALGAHYRVADGATQIALPEVKLGLLPGAGGTQRLPRAVGVELALRMIATGVAMPARELADTALFDAVVDGDVLGAALAFARELADQAGREAASAAGSHPRLRDRALPQAQTQASTEANTGEKAGGIADPAALYEAARAQARRTMKGQPAPLKCIDAIEYGVKHGFDAGLRFERECFVALVATSESRALRHAFFAERAAGKIAGVGSDTSTRDIAAIGVVGAGTMGRGIAMCFANAGLPVVLVETQADALQRGFAAIDTLYRGQVAAGKLAAAAAERRLALIRPSLAYEDLAQADLIVEAVFEDADVKQQVFGRLDALAKPGAILASNTSTLDLNRIAGFTGRPADVVGMHFFSPAHVMKLLEVVRGAQTSPEVLASVMKLARKIGKTAVVSGVCDGFIGNRMIEQYVRQALFMLEEGASPQQVDRAIENFGFAMGPFRMSDLAGNDIGWAIRKRRALERPDMVYPKIADRLCELGRFGQKTGAGWYDYAPGQREARPSAEVDALVREHAASRGIAQRTLSDDEIVERLLFALVNEGALILEAGIAARASDIDIVYLTGYGFPASRGGPMFYADSLGLAHVRDAIVRFQAQPNGAAWRLAPLLARLAETGERFNR